MPVPKGLFRGQNQRLHAVNRLYVMDETRHMDDSQVCALANGGGLLKAFPASESVPRTTIEAPNTPSPALSVTRILAAGFSS